MEQKYFTPDITDIRVGYEFEWKRYSFDDWNKTTITENDYVMYGQDPECEISEIASSFKKGDVRTPYLTREQIEAEGWEVFDNISYRKGSWHFTLGFPLISINNFKGFGCFSGSCPSINELRLIQKLLNIQ